MTIEHIRRGIEFDMIQSIYNLEKEDDGNRSSDAIADYVVNNCEKFVYIFADEPANVLLHHMDIILEKGIETANEVATGEYYEAHQRTVARYIESRVSRVKSELSSRNKAPKF